MQKIEKTDKKALKKKEFLKSKHCKFDMNELEYSP